MKIFSPLFPLLLTLLPVPTVADVILSNSCNSLGGFATTGDVDVRSVGCHVGSCFRMDGDGSSAASIATDIDTSGYSSVLLSFHAKSSSLENGEGCQAELSFDGGSTWNIIFAHYGGGELSWTQQTEQSNPSLDNNANVKLRFGTTVTSAADYCWFDTLLVEGTSGPIPTPSPTQTPVAGPTPAPVSEPTASGPTPSSCPTCLPASNYSPLTGNGVVSRSELSENVLSTGSGAPSSLVSWGHMEVPPNAAMPLHSFEGTLELPNVATENTNFNKVRDDFNYDSDAQRLHLPPVVFDLVSHGSHIIPAIRGTRVSSHPFWEIAMEPGRCWNENTDNGLSRCSLPFALTQRGSNCVHNGVLTFVFSNDNGGTISNAWHQIASETCLYYKFDFSALATATYSNAAVQDAATIRSAYAVEVASRLTTKDIDEVANDFSGASPSNLAPGADAEHVTYYGFVYKSVHYRRLGPTRVPGTGTFPYPDGLILPSYSTAKTHFFAAALMAIEQEYPGAMSATVSSLLPTASSSKWGDVTLRNVADMATGNYRFSQGFRDEGLLAVSNNFFLEETNSEKLDHALNYYSRKATPGSTWVYHTSDHYLGLAALQEYLRNQPGQSSTASILDYMISNVWSPMGGSEVLFQSRVTYDSVEMPFAAYGLFYLPNDVALLMTLMNTDQGVLNGSQIYDSVELNTALENDCLVDCGLLTPDGRYYQSGVWKIVLTGSCEYVPFASGYGGITMAMFPGGSNYYYFSDDEEFLWDSASAEALSIEGSCP